MSPITPRMAPMMDLTEVGVTLASRLEVVGGRIADAALRSGRSPSAVTLIAVTKTFPVEVVAALSALGQHDVGESRAQELLAKDRALEASVRWHFVGRLQRNKVPDVVGRAGLIHSVDRIPLAEVIGARAAAQGRIQPVLVQVNAGADPAKTGFTLDEAESAVARIRTIDGVTCLGLMTIPPREGDPRPVFGTLRVLRDDLRARFPEVTHLSMGMSADYETAIEEGATMVRLGEALLGPRDPDA